MLRPSQTLQLAVIALLGLGVVMVHSAGMDVGGDSGFSPLSMLWSRHSIYAALAVLAMFAASRIDLRQLQRSLRWRNPLWWLLGLALVSVALTLLPGVARPVRGASRWLYLGWGVSFQPSELLKWIMVPAIACWCAGRPDSMGKFCRGLLPPLLLIALACCLVVIEDLGTAVLIAAVSVVLLMAGGGRLWQLACMAPPAVAVVVAAIQRNPYRLDRLKAFVDPWKAPEGVGYHPIQSMLAVSEGGLFGRGLGSGIQKFGYLPEDTTDFLFAVICEELGLGGAVLVVGLLLLVLWTSLGILRNCPHFLGRLLTLGVMLTLGLQALINIAVVTVVVPTKGIALPLLSAGGTGWVLTAFSLGMVASLDEARWVQREEEGFGVQGSGIRVQSSEFRP